MIQLSLFVCDLNVMIHSEVATARAKDADVAEKSRATMTTMNDCLDDFVFFLAYLRHYDLYLSPSSPRGVDCGCLPLPVLSDPFRLSYIILTRTLTGLRRLRLI